VSDVTSAALCGLCDREVTETNFLSFHHWIPVTLHGNKWFEKKFSQEELSQGIYLCVDCHSAVHRFISEKDLGRTYNTKQRLLGHPEIRKFCRWVSSRSGVHRIAVRSSEQ
jgi:hypothetical protein